MENYTKELQSLKTELNSRIDAVIAKIEKPQFEVGKWYKDLSTKSMYYITQFNGIDKLGENYGFNYNGDWMVLSKIKFSKDTTKDVRLATRKEVEEAFIAEATKRGFKEGVKVKGFNENLGPYVINKDSNRFELYANNTMFSLNDVCLFDNGTWATPIKTMTIDELATELQEYTKKTPNSTYHRDYMNWFTKNKQQIIETLNTI